MKDGQAFVALEDISKPLGLRLARNSQLDSLDVSLVPSPASVEKSPSNDSSASAGVRRFENPALGISFWAPSKYLIVNDPSVLKNLLARGQKMASISLPATQVQQALEGFQFMCVDPKADGASRNDSLMMAIERLPSPSISNREYLSANLQSTIETFPGTKLVGSQTKKSIGGLDFLGQEYLRADPDGDKRFCRFYVAVNKQRGYFFQLAAESKQGLSAMEQLLDNLTMRSLDP